MNPSLQAEDLEYDNLDAEIQALEAELAPLQERLQRLRRLRAAHLAANASTTSRRQAVATRNDEIVAAASLLVGKSLHYAWQQVLANRFGISARQVRRILMDADVSVGRWG